MRYAEQVRRDPDYFGERELELVYVARRLKEALALEEVLTHHSVDYVVEPDKYIGGILFRRERVGAFFYVASDEESRVRQVMIEHGYQPHEAA